MQSAGTHALVGEPVTPQTAVIAEQLGVEIGSFRARQLETAQIRQADLVLALDRTHRAAVVELVPQAVRKTFTLRELARFLPLVTPEREARPDQRWRSAVALAQRQRRPPTDDPGSVDVVDPFRQSDEVYRQMVGQLVPAVDALLVWEARAGRPQR
ncbi:low molecular weight phosphatase family protein [Brevibacterium daeguense]|uniref:Low molecular weight phosphatase family protein n=1 Tax=Brevibacterium daeguense TaxID=909936 RepID=A0ABP8EKQ9_9MICO